MSNNAQKTPLGQSLNRFAERKVMDAFQRAGQALPCSVVSVDGAIITVKFEVNSTFTLPNVTVPMFGAEYIRYPVRTGDKGCVFPADARLSGMSGIGGGVADLSQAANLTALVFAPISNVAWSAVDPDAVTIYGPNGVVLRDTGSASTITLTTSGIAIESDAVTVTAPTTINGDVVVNGKITTTGDVIVGGNVDTATGDVLAGVISLKLHKTSLVTPGSGVGGPPVP